MKRYETILAAVNWYQNETYFEPLNCVDDGVKLIGRSHLGNSYLECPACGLRLYLVPQYVIKLYLEAHDIPTGWQVAEAKELADKLGRKLPRTILSSSIQISNYIKSARGKLLGKIESCS